MWALPSRISPAPESSMGILYSVRISLRAFFFGMLLMQHSSTAPMMETMAPAVIFSFSKNALSVSMTSCSLPT